jgi:hypothetical protein
VVRPGGRLVIAIPGSGHLEALRERFRLLAIEGDKAAKISVQMEGFELESTRRLTNEMRLDGPALRDLLEMTPNAWFMDDTTRAELDAVHEIETQIEFEVLTFIRRG